MRGIMPERILKDFRTVLVRIKRGEFEHLPPFFQSKFLMWFLVLVLAATISILTTMSLQHIPTQLQEGMIAPRDIKADKNYEIVDEEATYKFKQEAIDSILPVYDLDSLIVESITERIRLAFSNVRTRYHDIIDAKPKRGSKRYVLNEEDSKELRDYFSDNLGVTPTPAQWKLLLGERFSKRSEDFLIEIISKGMDRPVVAERAALDAAGNEGIVLRKLAGTKGSDVGDEYKETILKDVSAIFSTEEVRKLIGKIEMPSRGFRNPSYPKGIRSFAQELVEPDCSFNRIETDERRELAAENVKDVTLNIKSGEMIIREGSRYEPWHIKVLEGIRKDRQIGLYSLEFLGTLLLVLIFMVLPFYLAERFFQRIKPTKSDHFFMAFVGLSILVIVRLSIILAPALQSTIFVGAPTSALYYAIPLAGGAMLLRMYLSAEITMIFAVVISILSGFIIESDIQFMVFCLMTNFAAIIAVTRVDKRTAIIRAGAITGAIGVITILGSELISIATTTKAFTISDVLWGMILAFLGGIGCAIYTMIAAPIVESVSGYISDIKLLELANLNHPLLRELIVRAPGTYHHSHLVGVLGEAAAEAIGANPLLVRVGAYYHDIGKMKKPPYFIENAKVGDNKHEKLNPSMSALIVSAHVKDGMEMAKQAGIPRIITDMIPQHHGTRIMSFFYNKAKEMEDPTVEKVDQKDFKYPGPKPQSREAAILMLADVTEASVRSLKEKSTTRIQQTVQRAINDIFVESQLDECELTLRDLNEIAKSFVRILLGIYHQRIEYPKDKEQENGKTEISVVDEGSTREALDDEPTLRTEAKPKKD